MASPESQTTELTLTLKISSEARERLTQKAARSGQALAECVSTIIEQSVGPIRSLEEVSGPFGQEVLQSGMTEEELADFLEDVKHRRRAERRAEHTK